MPAIGFAPACAFLAVSSFVVLMGVMMHGTRWRMQARVDAVESRFSQARRSQPRRTLWKRLRGSLLPEDGPQHRGDVPKSSASLQARLLMAGMYAPGARQTYLFVRMLLGTAPLLVGGVLYLFLAVSLKSVLPTCLGVGALGFLAPGLFLNHRIAKRQAILRRSLPDFLDLMITCVEGGMSLHAATDQVTQEMELAHPLLTIELKQLQREISLGGTPDAAMGRLAERSGVESIAGLATAVQQSIQFGTALTEALRNHADVLRTEREQAAEERAQRASVMVLAPTMLFIFPVTFVVLAGPAAIELQKTFGAKAERGASAVKAR